MKAHRTFWSTANEAFSAKERSQYNKFKIDLYTAQDRLRDALPVADNCDDRRIAEIRQRANDLRELISTMPIMEA